MLAPEENRAMISQSRDATSSASLVDTGTSKTPVGANPVPAVTLRRVGPAHSFYDEAQVQQYIDLLTGISDVVTLVNVEVVEPTQNSLRISSSQNELMTLQAEADLMTDIDNDDGIERTPTARSQTGSLLFVPGQANVNSGIPIEHNSGEGSVNSFGDLQVDPIFDYSTLPIVSNTRDVIPILHDGSHSPRITQFHDLASAHRPLPSPTPLEVQCQACRENLRKPIFITCGHAYCQECLNRLFRIGTSNRASWPPRCCGGNLGIEIEGIQRHLDEDILIRYVTVSDEYGDRNPMYCANKHCSHYFEQTRVTNKQGKFIQCSECDTQTCTECKQNFTEHIGLNQTVCKEIQDLMTEEDQKLATSKRWKQCPGCRNLVERIDGCSHMTCSCGIDFCYDCGIKRQGWTTACACRSRANRARRQPHPNPDGENTTRRAMRRVLDSPVFPIPRRLRQGGDPNPTPPGLEAIPHVAAPTPPAIPPLQVSTPPTPGFQSFPGITQAQVSSTAKQASGPRSPENPATPTTYGGPYLNDLPRPGFGPSGPVVPRRPDGTRTDAPSTTTYARTPKPVNLNNQTSVARTISRIETHVGLSSNVTFPFANGTVPPTGRSTPIPDSATPKRPAERTLRPRLTPQYDNSRPLFSVSQGSSTRTGYIPTQLTPPRRQTLLTRPADIRTSVGEDMGTQSVAVSDKRSHSPDTTSQRRNARHSWMTGTRGGPFQLNNNHHTSGEMANGHRRPNSMSQTQPLPGLTPSYAGAQATRPSP